MHFPFSRTAFFVCILSFLIAVACTRSDPTPIPTPTIPPTPTSTPTLTPTPYATPSPEPTPTPDEHGIIWYDPIPATITVEDSTIIFVGDIELETYRDFLDAVRGKENQITTIRVNSPGGITDQGILIGQWIFDHEIDVIVEEQCFSSCANYVFTAGKNKIIEKDAIVGWHGSEQQEPFIAAGLGLTMRELHVRNYDRRKEFGGPLTPNESKEEYVENMLKYDEYERVDDESEFLEKIGVNLYLMVYGFLPDQFDYYMTEQTEFGGWTFSIEDMAKFGVHNVTYEGEGRYPSEKAIENFSVAVFDVPTATVPPAVVPTPLPPPTPPPGSTLTPTPDTEFDAQADRWVEPPPADMTVEGDTVVISGYLNFNAFIRFRSAILGKEDEITTLRITSDGGILGQAIFIGFWVYDNEIDVIVDGSCFSECANYIFTAGKNKVIEEFALVGWYGSPQGKEYEARALGLSIEEALRRNIDIGMLAIDPSLDEQGKEEFLQENLDYIREEIELERQFLDATRINDAALVYGFIDVDYEARGRPGYFFEGWTFTIESMAKLGIENVTYDSKGRYPAWQTRMERYIPVFYVP